jgi:hypothetical protein
MIYHFHFNLLQLYQATNRQLYLFKRKALIVGTVNELNSWIPLLVHCSDDIFVGSGCHKKKFTLKKLYDVLVLFRKHYHLGEKLVPASKI